jgi:hypothetical protein
MTDKPVSRPGHGPSFAEHHAAWPRRLTVGVMSPRGTNRQFSSQVVTLIHPLLPRLIVSLRR